MIALRRERLKTAYRRCGIAIGILLFAIECIDAMVTPRPDWLWFGAATLLIFLCRPRWMRRAENHPVD